MVNKVLFVGYCLVVALALAAVTTAQQPALDSVQTSLNTCYNAIIDAYNSGVDTTSQIAQLNQALNLTSQAQIVANTDPQLSHDLDAQTQVITENVTHQAIAAKEAVSTDLPIISIASISAVIIIGVSVYVFGPRLLWHTWFRLRKNYRVKVQTSQGNDKAIVITAQQLCAVPGCNYSLSRSGSLSGFHTQKQG
jgi:hypothetical protein